MARVPYASLEDDTSPNDLSALFHEITRVRGRVLNLYRALANQPEALRRLMTMSRYVRDDAALPPKLRELAVLTTAYALDVPYEQYHHIPAARRAGVTEAQLAALPEWRNASVFNEAERAVVAYADQVARSRQVDDETFALLRANLSTGEIIDLALTVGWYHLCAAILQPLQIDIEEAPPTST